MVFVGCVSGCFGCFSGLAGSQFLDRKKQVSADGEFSILEHAKFLEANKSFNEADTYLHGTRRNSTPTESEARLEFACGDVMDLIFQGSATLDYARAKHVRGVHRSTLHYCKSLRVTEADSSKKKTEASRTFNASEETATESTVPPSSPSSPSTLEGQGDLRAETNTAEAAKETEENGENIIAAPPTSPDLEMFPQSHNAHMKAKTKEEDTTGSNLTSDGSCSGGGCLAGVGALHCHTQAATARKQQLGEKKASKHTLIVAVCNPPDEDKVWTADGSQHAIAMALVKYMDPDDLVALMEIRLDGSRRSAAMASGKLAQGLSILASVNADLARFAKWRRAEQKKSAR